MKFAPSTLLVVGILSKGLVSYEDEVSCPVGSVGNDYSSHYLFVDMKSNNIGRLINPIRNMKK